VCEATGLGPLGQRLVAGAPGEGGVLVAHRPDARAGRRYDHVVRLEHVDVVLHDRQRLALVAGVDVHLAAAGLLGGNTTSWPSRSSTVTVARATEGNMVSARQVTNRAMRMRSPLLWGLL
jgi:hypothetical protein